MDYRTYREFVRADFAGHCAYCLTAEILAGGEDNFELDHFRPKSKFPELINDFFNIYYSCHPCNNIKGPAWPPPNLEARGVGFVDLCRDDFETHFRLAADGLWEANTASGRYTIDRLRLNRKHLVIIRRLCNRLGYSGGVSRAAEEQLAEIVRRLNALER